MEPLNPKELNLWLSDWNFRLLDVKLNTIQTAFEQDTKQEEVLVLSFALFEDDLEPKLQKAVEVWAREFPNSYAARLALGKVLVHQGYTHRGTATADQVSQDQWVKTKQSFLQAEDHLEASLSLTAKPLLSHTTRLGMSMVFHDHSTPEQQEWYYYQALRCNPTSFVARQIRLATLRPEWSGGDLRLLHTFISSPTHDCLEPSQQKKLRAIAYAMEGHWHQHFTEDWVAALEAYDKAIEIEVGPNRLSRRALVKLELDKFREALEDVIAASKHPIKDHDTKTYFAMASAKVGSRLAESKDPKVNELSIALLSAALSHRPDFNVAKAFLGRAYQVQNPRNPKIRPLLQAALSDGLEFAKPWLAKAPR